MEEGKKRVEKVNKWEKKIVNSRPKNEEEKKEKKS